MGITEKLRVIAEDVWIRIINHPFVLGLYRGDLPMDKFRFYLIQDYNYLITLTRCQSMIASKLEDPLIMRRILELALTDITTELESYAAMLNELGLKLGDVIKVRPSPTNIAYMNFLLTTCSLGSPWEGLVAILPCYWTYLDIARHNEHLLRMNTVDLFKRWCRIYLSEDYAKIVNELRDIIDSHSDYLMRDLDRLSRVFRQAAIYELMFWDMAYKQEEWII